MLCIDYAEQFDVPYIFGGNRYNADSGTDCSGLVCAAFYNVHGVKPSELGDWTGAQWSEGEYTRTIWYGTSPDLPYDEMQRGDLIFTSNCSSDFSTGNGSHIGFYTGDPDAPFLSHFASNGPRVTAVNGVYGNECYYGVKRILLEEESEDDMSAEDVWNFEQNGTLMRDRVQGTDQAANSANEQLTRRDDVSGRGTDANLYERVCYLGARTAEQGEQLSDLQTKVNQILDKLNQ